MTETDDKLEAAIAGKSSRLPGFYRLSAESRREAIARWVGLDETDLVALDGGVTLERADAMIENAVGGLTLPLGIATNFVVNDRDVLVPMAIEEPSVVAAASHGALLARSGGGFVARSDEPIMIGQVQVVDLAADELDAAARRIEAARDQMLAVAHAQSATLARLGGGAKDLLVRRLPSTPGGPMLVVHLLYDTRDAMGANAINTVCEAVAPLIQEASGGRVLLRILSNLADRRLACAACSVRAEALATPNLAGKVVAERIAQANALAVADPYRAATHNKGIMNGIDPVVIATGNDWRGVEAGAHAHAAREGQYRSLTEWRVTADGDLAGQLEVPLALGVVGGGTKAHPGAALALRILGVSSSRELAEIVASVGLAQNLAALRALVSEGIQSGHMALHARQLALAAGATSAEAGDIAAQMVSSGEVSASRARELVEQLRNA